MRENTKQRKLFSTPAIVPDEKASNFRVFARWLKKETLNKPNNQNQPHNPNILYAKATNEIFTVHFKMNASCR